MRGARCTQRKPCHFERIAEAPVVVTCVVETTTRDKIPLGRGRAVEAHATLVVLRTLGPDIARCSRIRLDYEALPEDDSDMSGPDLPPLTPGITRISCRSLLVLQRGLPPLFFEDLA